MVSGVPFAEHSDDDFDLAISSGLWGVFRFMRRAFPLLSVNGGSIVNIVSSAGTHGLPGFAGYYRVTRWQRTAVATAYLGLAALLVVAMNATHIPNSF